MDNENRDLDERGRPLSDKETGEPIRWATRGQRIAALIGAIVVILITAAYIYAIYTGRLFQY